MSFWNNIPRSTVRELAKAAGLRSSNAYAVADLEQTYGPVPTIEFVDEMWIVLRDGWLQRTAAPRQELIRQMRAIGRGDMTIKTGSKAGQVAYLRTLRRSPALLEPLLRALPGLRCRGTARTRLRPGTIRRRRPTDQLLCGGERPTPFHRCQHDLGSSNVSSTSAGRSAMAEIPVPAEQSLESAVRLAGAIVTALLVDHDDAEADADPQPHQAWCSTESRARAADAASTEEFVSSYVFALKPAFEDPNATTESVALYASAVFFAMLAVSSPDEAPGLVEEIKRSHQRFDHIANQQRVGGASGAGDLEISFDEALVDAMQEAPDGHPADADR